jgi:hypothetical protein
LGQGPRRPARGRPKAVFLLLACCTQEEDAGPLKYLNHLRSHPQWYNALTRNCQTTMGRGILGESSKPPRWISRFTLNGSLDELLYNRGRLVTGGLSFQELRRRESINSAAKAAKKSSNFSSVIRVGRVGF